MISETQARTQTTALAILAAVALGAALHWLRPVLVPFVLAVFLAFALAPVVSLLHKRLRVPRAVALFLAFLLTLTLLVAFGVLVSTSVAQMAQNAEAYRSQVSGTWDKVELFLGERFSVDVRAYIAGDEFQAKLNAQVGRLTAGLVGALNGILSQGFLVLLFIAFLLAGSTGGRPLSGIWAEVRDRSRRYIVTKLATSAVTGALTWLILSLLGVQPALVFGTLAFFLNFVPSVGSVIATLLPLPVILVDPSIGTTTAAAAIALPGLAQFTIGNVIEPRVMGASLDLHPVTVILALIFWGTLWGIVGALLATPITAVVALVLQRIEVTRPFAALMAGRLESEAEPATGGRAG